MSLPDGSPSGSFGAAWIIDAHGCDPTRLRDPDGLRALLDCILEELRLLPAGGPLVRAFMRGGEP